MPSSSIDAVPHLPETYSRTCWKGTGHMRRNSVTSSSCLPLAKRRSRCSKFCAAGSGKLEAPGTDGVLCSTSYLSFGCPGQPSRLPNPPHVELVNAAKEQMKIAELRICKMAGSPAADAVERRTGTVLRQLAVQPTGGGGACLSVSSCIAPEKRQNLRD